MNKETQAFEVSPAIIRHLIESQAGSLEKALLELVMNGIDATATRIDIRFESANQIVVEDNGFGFASRDEINKYFKVFGFDHQTEAELERNRHLGRFGLGRGQMMAFAATTWETNQFRLEVDIRDKDLVFSVTELDSSVCEGCRITANLYEPVSRVCVDSIKRELKQQTLYSPVAVFVDGQRVNRDRDAESWTETTDAFHFKIKPNVETGVDVYNLGIFVRRYPHQQMGVSGVLVSRSGHAFAVNMARNDVLQSKCTVWKAAKNLIEHHSAQRRSSTKLCDADRIAILRELISGVSTIQQYEKARLFKEIRGRYMTLSMLQRHAAGRFCIANVRGSQVGEAIHRSNVAAVLAPEITEWLGCDSAEDVATLLCDLWSVHGRSRPAAFEAVDFSELTDRFSGRHTLVDRGAWTKLQQAQVKALEHASGRLRRVIYSGSRYDAAAQHRVRRILVGDSDVAQMWTDGSSYIAVEAGFLKANFDRGLNGIARLCNVMVHEYLHSEPDDSEHVHSPEFYEAYEDILCSPFLNQFELLASTFDRYRKERAKRGLNDTKAIARTMDQLDLAFA